MTDEKLDVLLEVVAENTTTLIKVEEQSAATSASVKDARQYIQTVARQTSWETNGKAIAAVLTKALEKDHEALHAASRAAQEMRGLSVELTRKTDRAAETQQDASNKFHFAAERLLKVTEAHEQGKWRRMGMIALIGALCGAVGFFAREPAAKYTHLFEAGTALKQDAFGTECKGVRGESFTNDGRSGCVVWEDLK
jgi:type VI protein secretion system component VasK